jgi:hypothetical protein
MNTQTLEQACTKRGNKAAAAADKMKDLARLLRRYFRDKYDDRKVRENIAADYGVCRRTAGLWMSTGPTSRHLVRIIAKEGMAFVSKVIHPIATIKEANAHRLEARQAALEAQLAAEQADLAADVAGAGSVRRRVAPRAVSVIGALKARLRHEVA